MVYNKVFETAVVKRVSSKWILVERTNIGACRTCGIRGVCGMMDMSEVLVYSDEMFEIGEKVELLIKPSVRVWSGLLVFITPIVFLILFYLLGHYVFGLNEGWAVFVSIFGSGLGFVLLKWIDGRYGKQFEVRVRKVI
jgi:positive regulator of sigma E activity